MKYLLALFISSISIICQCQNFYFPPTESDTWETTPLDELGWCEEAVPELLSFLEDSQTKGFILLKEGRVVIEEYFNGHDQDSIWYWASAGKSLKAFELGMLQE